MCSICKKYPCDSRCPNAEEEKPVMVCSECRADIFKGDKYFETPSGPVCMDCLEGMTVGEILDLVGEGLSKAI